MVNARRKGKEGELQAVALFRSWWGGQWSRKKIGVKGDDIQAPDDFPCSLEVKNRAKVAVRNFFEPTKQLCEWWQQAKDQAAVAEKLPMLCTKTERDWYCALKMRDCMAAGFSLPATYLVSQWAEDLVVVMRIGQFIDSNPRAVDEK